MDQQGVNVGGMLSWRLPPYGLGYPWPMYQAIPMLYNLFRNEAEPTTFGNGPIGIETSAIENCTIIHTDINDQLQVVDENEVPQQQLQERFADSSDKEEIEPTSNEVAKGNTIDADDTNDTADLTDGHLHTLNKPSTGEQRVQCEREQLPAEFHAASHSCTPQMQCSSFQHSSTGQTKSPVVAGPNRQDHTDQIDSVIQAPHHILFDATEMVGKLLNALVAQVHRMTSNKVKFHIEAEVWQGEDDRRRLSLTREEPVTDPSDFDRYPEAFDCRRILQHMRKCQNLQKYAEILDCRHSKHLKREIDGILGRIPGKKTSRSPRPTWDSLFDTLHKMKSFIEQAAAGLRRNNEDGLATELGRGYNNLEMIIARAAKAQEMSRQ